MSKEVIGACFHQHPGEMRHHLWLHRSQGHSVVRISINLRSLKASSAAEIIGFLSDENDEDATDIFRYLNMSQMYYVDSLKLENITGDWHMEEDANVDDELLLRGLRACAEYVSKPRTTKLIVETPSYVHVIRSMNMENDLKEDMNRRMKAAWAAFAPVGEATDQLMDRNLCAHLFDSASTQHLAGLRSSVLRAIFRLRDPAEYMPKANHRWAGYIMRRIDVCELLSNVTFLISACESEASRQLVVDVSHLSALPTIQIVRNNWRTVDGSTLPNQIYIVTTGTIFEYVILDIFPFLNIALDVTVLFDKTYRNTNNLRNVFEMLPVPVTFVNLQTNAAMLQRQVKHLKAIASKNIVVVADTAMIEMIVKEASVYFDASNILLFDEIISINIDNLLPTSHKITDSFGVELWRLGGEEIPKVIFEVVTIIVALLFQVMLKRSEELIVARAQLSAVDLGSNCRVVRQQFKTVDSVNSSPDAQHDLLLMDFTFHERIRHLIASAPRTFVGVVDVEDPFFISSYNGVQPVECAAFGEQLSADVQPSLAVAVAQCMWEPLTELFHHSERSQSIAHGGQRTAKAGSKIPHAFMWMLLRQILQFVGRYCSRSTRAKLIFEFLVSGFEALELGAHRPPRRGFSAEYVT
ncbi:hypothetical protein RB195_024218 [Necator americanus]|uniref:Uncharacterized protein n=1 Tax=Necator americanus TaxID=51031 RepID=A0ABR1EMF5_NECAM